MNETSGNGSIVVDVDGTVSGRDAVAWATTEARRRNARVHVSSRRDPQQVLLEAPDASLIVVGSASFLEMNDLAEGSTAMAVAVHANVPVIVVRPGLPDTMPGPSAGRVVVGTDGGSLSDAAIAFAMDEARGHGCGLTVVQAVEQDGDRAGAEVALAPLTARQEDVRIVVATGVASRVLIEESAGARMLVVGSRGRGGLGGMLLGSVSQAVVHRAHCPVAVVRE